MEYNQGKEITKLWIKGLGSKFLNFLKWTVVSGVIGVVIGLVGTAFSHGMHWVTAFRAQQPLIILGLPIAGLLIVFLYHMGHRDNDKGTNSVLAAVRSETQLPITVAPLIFLATLLTHLFGGSAGREGAALQLGGSIGNWMGKIFHMKKSDVHVMIMCGMSACFSALFGTPLAAAFFPMEVVNVGVMYYTALVPCAFSSLIAAGIARSLGVGSEAMTIAFVPEFTLLAGSKTVVLAVLCAAISVVFCVALHLVHERGRKLLPNPYLRIALAGTIIVGINLALQTTDYLGAGMDVIERTMEGEVRPEAFLLKIILTALTLGAGFKGGEIVPSFFVGATFGCMMGGLLGLSPSLCAAVGMVAVFCGVTNSPITSLLIALELFGMDAMPFFLLGVAVSYMLSGYHSLYHTQKIIYSKYKGVFHTEKEEDDTQSRMNPLAEGNMLLKFVEKEKNTTQNK